MNALRSKSLPIVQLAVAAALVAGCRAPKASDFKPSNIFSLKSSWPWRDGDEPEEGTPVRIVGAWTDTVRSEPGKKPQRGFGGRLMFYGPEGDQPILVEGQLVVYAFDESGREPTDNKPTRRYVFPSDQVPLHMSTSEIGASYSFWLPWDEAGGPRTEVSLICRFEPKDGAVVTSEQTRHLLPGAIALNSATAGGTPPRLPEGTASRPARPTLEDLRSKVRTEGGAQLASYESPVSFPATASQPQAAPASAEPARRMQVTSIRLPDNFQLPSAADVVATPAASRTPALPQPPATPLHQRPAGQSPPPAAPPSTQPAPPVQPLPTASFGSINLPRPQIVAPQLTTRQPAPGPAAVTTPGISYSAPATSQPAAR